MNSRSAALSLALVCIAALAGCERQMSDMYSQPRYDQGQASPLFADGKSDRPPPGGAVAAAAGDLAETSSGRKGRGVPQQWDEESGAMSPPRVDRTLLLRGQERFAIYCLPCHGSAGDGDGPVVQRGFPAPPTYHQQRLRDATDRYLFDVITNGRGVMYPYADHVALQDRWAIVAYIRALQLSQHAVVSELPKAMLDRLQTAPMPQTGASAPQGAIR